MKLARALAKIPSGAWDWLAVRRLGPPAEAENAAIEELRRDFAALPPLEAEAGAKVASSWTYNRLQLREMISRHDPRGFLTWDVVRRTMFTNQALYAWPELQALRQAEDWPQVWKPLVREIPVGTPMPCIFYPAASVNVIHHAYHFHSLAQQIGRRPADYGVICEFGGGYGSLCRLARALGFRGHYFIYDIPEFWLLQRFYLRCAGLTAALAQRPDAGVQAPSIQLLHAASSLDALPGAISAASGRSLFIATWSMSEAPLELRSRLEAVMAANLDVLLAYQSSFDAMDNVAYFRDLAARWKNYRWQECPIAQLPGSSYLFGSRAD